MLKEGYKQYNYLTTSARLRFLKIAALSEGIPVNKFLDKLIDEYAKTIKKE